MPSLEPRIDILHLPDSALSSQDLQVRFEDELYLGPLEEELVAEKWARRKNKEVGESRRLFLDYAHERTLILAPGNYSTFFVADQMLKTGEVSLEHAENILDKHVSVLGVGLVYKTADNGIVILKKDPAKNYQGKDACVIITGGVPYADANAFDLFKTVGFHASKIGQSQSHIQNLAKYVGIARDTDDGANANATFALGSNLEAGDVVECYNQSGQDKYIWIAHLSSNPNHLLETFKGNYIDMKGNRVKDRIQRVHLGGILLAGKVWYGDEWFELGREVLLDHKNKPVKSVNIYSKFTSY